MGNSGVIAPRDRRRFVDFLGSNASAISRLMGDNTFHLTPEALQHAIAIEA